MTSPQLKDLSLNYRCSRFFPLRNIQTCSGSYPVFYPVINFNPSPSFKAAGAWSWKITVHPTPSLRMSGVTVYISYIPYYGHVKPLPLPQFFSIIIPTQISWSGLKFTWIEDASLGQDFRHFHRIYQPHTRPMTNSHNIRAASWLCHVVLHTRCSTVSSALARISHRPHLV